MANKKIIELDAASQVNSDALFPLSQLVNSNRKTLKATVAQMQAAMLAPVSDLVTLGESSGSIASFSTDIADKLFSCYVNVTAQQAGSGTPTPDNVRAISGWSACDLSVNSVVTTISFGSTVYGGVLDVLSGVLTVTHGIVDLGDLTWTYADDYVRFLTLNITDVKRVPDTSTVPNFICSIYSAASSEYFDSASKPNYTMRGNTANSAVFIRNTDYNDATAFKTAMSGVNLVYELATPTTIQLTPTEVKTILGQNNIFADTGDIDLKYLETIGNRL